MKYSAITYATEDQNIQQKVEAFIQEWYNDSSEIVVHTSGSTGIPKEIRLQKMWMRNSALASGNFFQFKKNQRVVLAMNSDTIGGKMLILRAILHEMELIVTDVVRNPLKNLQEHIDFISLVPMQISTVLAESPEKLDLIKTVLIGGAAVAEAIESKLAAFDVVAYESFGMTETMSHVALKRLNADGVFHAIDGITFSQEDDGLVIHAAMLGYEKLLTNDSVELLSATSFRWKGRKDFVINSGGYKFFPEILEKKIGAQITNRYFISSEDDALLGQRIILLLEGKYTDFELVNVRNILEQTFTRYEKPKEIYLIPAFVETPSGKINRLATKNIR